MVNSSGACRLAATVWPGSMVRVSTTPSTGERITVRPRLMRVVWVDAVCWRDLRLRGVDLGPGLVARGAGEVDVALRHQLLLAEVGLALVIEFGIAQRGLRLPQRCLRAGDLRVALRDLRLVGARVDARDDLVLGHLVVEIDQHFGHLAGNLAAHGDRGDGAERAGGRDRHADVAALDRAVR